MTVDRNGFILRFWCIVAKVPESSSFGVLINVDQGGSNSNEKTDKEGGYHQRNDDPLGYEYAVKIVPTVKGCEIAVECIGPFWKSGERCKGSGGLGANGR